ncbi:MAG TPA: signal peptidase I [Anaerolineales bacterium]|nr:signal peptidase I [Anaerolineales bacterium]
MKSTSQWTSVVARAALVAGLAAAWVVLAPSAFGGQTSYIIVAGASMEPTLHQGDLVLARSAASYDVGQIVAYHHPLVGPVIHRIIDRSGAHYVLQGDNNGWIDSYTPAAGEIVGRSWIVVRHAGTLLMSLRTPAGLAVLSLLLAALVVMTVGGGPLGRPSTGKPRRPPPRPPEGALFAVAVLAVGSLLLAAASFSHATLQATPQQADFHQTGRFGYHTGAPATVYSGADLQTGDPIFDALVPSFVVDFDYDFASADPSDVRGTVALTLEVSEPNGWKRTMPIAAPTDFRGTRAHAQGRVDTGIIRRMIALLENATSLDRDSYLVDVVADVRLQGRLAEQDLQTSLQSRLPFALDDFELYLRRGEPSDSDGDPTTTFQDGALTYAVTAPATLSILGAQVPVKTARAVSVVGFLVAAGLAAFLLVPRLRSRKQGEAARVLAEYGRLLVSVKEVPVTGTPIEVDSFADLLRLSERSGQTILHSDSGLDHDFFVRDGETTYHLRLSLAGEADEEGTPA